MQPRTSAIGPFHTAWALNVGSPQRSDTSDVGCRPKVTGARSKCRGWPEAIRPIGRLRRRRFLLRAALRWPN